MSPACLEAGQRRTLLNPTRREQFEELNLHGHGLAFQVSSLRYYLFIQREAQTKTQKVAEERSSDVIVIE